MEIFEAMARKEHDQLLFWSDVASGYRGLVAIHDTTLGPALGGTRFWGYETEAEAVTDVLRLSRAMTYKNTVAGMDRGGSKICVHNPDIPGYARDAWLTCLAEDAI